MVLWLVVVAVVATGGIAGYRFFLEADNQEHVELPTITVGRGDIINVVSATGYLSAEASIDLKGNKSGTVKEILVAEGEAVKKGQILVRLEDDEENMMLLEAKNSLEDSILELESARVGRSPASEINRLERQLTLKQLQVQLQQTDLDNTVVSAPFAGTISEIYVEEGELAAGDTVNASEPILRLVDLSSLYAEVNVDEVDIARVRTGQSVNVAVDAYPSTIFTGKVTTIAPEATNNSGIVIVGVTVLLDSADPRLKPGFTTSVDIIIEQARGVLILPTEEVLYRGGRYSVMLLQNDEPTPTEVEVGISDGTNIEIREGLREGDVIASVGLDALIAARKRADIADADTNSRGGPAPGAGVRFVGPR